MEGTIILKEHQRDHFTHIMSIIDRFLYYMDFSKMGTGKTYVCGKVAETLGLSLFVVCPVSAENAWLQMERTTGVHIHFIVSYQSLRGSVKYPPKHPYLTRRTVTKVDKKGKSTESTIFEPTQTFLDVVDKGILLVFDEGQNIKNSSDQGKASRVLSSCIRGRSRCAFISGSPYDKPEHSENILRFLAILKSKNLIWSNPLTGEKVPKGILDVVNFCKELDTEKTQELTASYPDLWMTAKEARELCHNLFSQIIKEHMYSEMMPEVCEYPVKMEESYLYLRDKPLKDLTQAIDALAQATRFNGKDVDTEQIEWGAVTLALKRIELIMVEPMVKFANTLLTGNNKVIISVTYLDTVTELMNQFKDYAPLFINGEINARERAHRVNTFNTDPKHRVFICTIKTGGISISLHDIVGDSPRHMLLVPTYSIIDIYQASGRIHRTGLKSNAYFYMIYGTNPDSKDTPKGSLKVTPILNALSRKKDILKSLITKQSEIYKLPGEFDCEYYDV